MKRGRYQMRLHSRGAALLAAMLTVTLVATFAAAAMWQQWRNIEVETAERARIQSAWILIGALDWSRLILAEDGRSSGPDHLAEPWAVPLEEARLSTFLAAQDGAVVQDASTDTQDAFLSGRILDMQARLNLRSLLDNAALLPEVHAQFERLFAQLGLPASQLASLEQDLLRASAAVGTSATSASDAPLMPQQVEQIGWLGLPPSSVRALTPYVTVLPARTTVNLNTAPSEVLLAAIDGLDRAGAERLLNARETTPFRSLQDAAALLGETIKLDAKLVGYTSHYFEVQGRLRLGDAAVSERSLVQRNGTLVNTLWRARAADLAQQTPR